MNDNVILRGFGGGKPLFVERTDQKFIDSTQSLIAQDDPLTALEPSLPDRDSDHSLMLYQPVHRTFNLALLEVLCDQFGEPRLDPDKLDSSGFVIRRVVKTDPNASSGTVTCDEAWVESEHVLRGWLPLDGNDDLDPDPTRRNEPFHAGQAEMKRLLARVKPAAAPLTESTTTLFPAAPDVCVAAKKTVLLGVIPTATLETAEASPAVVAAQSVQYDDDEVDAQIPIYFKPGPGWNVDGIAGQPLTTDWADAAPAANPGIKTYVDKYVLFLRAIQIQFDVFGDSTESAELLDAIGQVTVYQGGTPYSAASHLQLACQVVVMGDDTVGNPIVPDRYGPISSQLGTRLKNAFAAAMNRRANAVLPPEGRFEDENARYILRGFVRVRRDDGCPPELVWSPPSDPFVIVPWHQSGKLPPIKISLPNVTRGNIKNFKPNVVFKVPGNLFNFLQKNTPKNLLDGKGSDGGDGIDWLCGFNIPLITICAFIILYIFLTLLNIVFWWLPFIRICIPLPRKARL